MAIEKADIRRFGIGDMMALIAATAVGFFTWRLIEPFKWNTADLMAVVWDRKETVPWRVPLFCFTLSLILHPFLLAWTVALMGLRLVSRRPTRRRLWSSPGFVASVAALLPIAINFLMNLLLDLLPTLLFSPEIILEDPHFSLSGYLARILLDPTDELAAPSLAICASWLVLGMNRRWRPERSWIDRAGRVAGVAWVAFYLIRAAYSLLPA